MDTTNDVIKKLKAVKELMDETFKNADFSCGTITCGKCPIKNYCKAFYKTEG